jgi:hypothetical protein
MQQYCVKFIANYRLRRDRKLVMMHLDALRNETKKV